MQFPLRYAASSLLLLFVAHRVSAQDGGAIYKRSCAPCHEAGVDRAPSHEALHAMSPERVLAAMESGPMISMANRQSEAARRAIAEYITGKSFAHPMDTAPPAAAMCAAPAPDFGDPLSSGATLWNGWGQNLLNTRFQTTAQAGLNAADVSRLKVKWSFGFPATLDANAHPAIANGRVFIGSTSGIVYSLDAATGCIRWYFNAVGGVRSAISICLEPEDIAILPDSTKAFVSCSGSGQVASVDLKNDKLLALLDVGKGPVSLALKPDGGEIVAFNFDAGSISIVETTPNEVLGSYLVGAKPTRGVFSLDNSRLYISNFESNNIAVYDIDLGKVVAFLPVGTRPDALALTQSQQYLLVVDTGSSDLAVIQKRTPKKKFEPSEYSLLTIIPVGVQPNQIAVKSFLATKPRDGR